ncbi:hypothetical protein RHO13_01950 [Orbus wheelerorum]|uniref:hypothetical protein n=1 Tax=Orbus wheelerorum TaxID=3074111 RepID=UPI00370D9FB6
MADIADSANDISQLEIESILKNRVVEKPAYHQVCRYCKKSTPDGYPFCDSDCRDDFERLNKYGANNA